MVHWMEEVSTDYERQQKYVKFGKSSGPDNDRRLSFIGIPSLLAGLLPALLIPLYHLFSHDSDLNHLSPCSNRILYVKPILRAWLSERPDDTDSKHLRNVNNLLPNYQAQQPRRQSSSSKNMCSCRMMVLYELRISHCTKNNSYTLKCHK